MSVRRGSVIRVQLDTHQFEHVEDWSWEAVPVLWLVSKGRLCLIPKCRRLLYLNFTFKSTNTHTHPKLALQIEYNKYSHWNSLSYVLERILRVNQIIIRGQFRLLTHHTLRTTSHHLSTYFSTQPTLIFIQLQARLISQPQLVIALSIRGSTSDEVPRKFPKLQWISIAENFPRTATVGTAASASTIKAKEMLFSHISSVHNNEVNRSLGGK